MSVKLLTAHDLEFLSLKGGCTGSSESTLVKMPHCWKLHVMAHFINFLCLSIGVRAAEIIEIVDRHNFHRSNVAPTNNKQMANRLGPRVNYHMKQNSYKA